MDLITKLLFMFKGRIMNELVLKAFSFLKDGKGEASTMRVMSFSTVMILMGTWAYVCISTGQLVSFGKEELGLLMIAFGAKGYQKGQEVKKDV